MTDLFNLTGKVALITGGAGGIGRAQALGLADAGADVAITSRKLGHLEEVAKEIATKGQKSFPVTVDVVDEKSVTDMVDSVLKEFWCVPTGWRFVILPIRSRSMSGSK